RLHPKENFFPASVDWYLQHVRLHQHLALVPGCAAGQITPEKLMSTCLPEDEVEGGCTTHKVTFQDGYYDRGAGTVPTECPAGKEKYAGLCYSQCPAGYDGVFD